MMDKHDACEQAYKNGYRDGRAEAGAKFIELCEKLCDNYCKYPSEYKDPDDLFNAHCYDCPMNEVGEVFHLAWTIRRR